MRLLSVVILGGVLSIGCPASKTTPTNPIANPTDPDAESGEGVTDEGKPLILGGYASAEVGSADVVAAAEKTLPLLQEKLGDKSIALKSIKSAEKQVVAGMNYRMTLELTTKSGTKEVKVVVFHDLENNYSLTSSEGL